MTAVPVPAPVVAVPALAELAILPAIPARLASIAPAVFAPVASVFTTIPAVVAPILSPVPATITAIPAVVPTILGAIPAIIAAVFPTVTPVFTPVCASVRRRAGRPIGSPILTTLPAILAPLRPRIGRRASRAVGATVFSAVRAILAPFRATLLTGFSTLLSLRRCAAGRAGGIRTTGLLAGHFTIAVGAAVLGEGFACAGHDRHDERRDRRGHDEAFHVLFPRSAFCGGMDTSVPVSA